MGRRSKCGKGARRSYLRQVCRCVMSKLNYVRHVCIQVWFAHVFVDAVRLTLVWVTRCPSYALLFDHIYPTIKTLRYSLHDTFRSTAYMHMGTCVCVWGGGHQTPPWVLMDRVWSSDTTVYWLSCAALPRKLADMSSIGHLSVLGGLGGCI